MIKRLCQQIHKFSERNFAAMYYKCLAIVPLMMVRAVLVQFCGSFCFAFIHAMSKLASIFTMLYILSYRSTAYFDVILFLLYVYPTK